METMRAEVAAAQEELERRIIYGLSQEWEHAIWILSPDYQACLKKPLFCLKDMGRKLGYWSSEKREICLSRNFVLNHSWNAARDVLRHEIAHQFAEEGLGGKDETDHGPLFKEACHLLRANPKATGTYKPLSAEVDDEREENSDKIMIRVKKLLSLAKSKNKHEAEAAMAKAYELIAKYNVHLLHEKKKRDYISVFLGKPALRHFREVYHLSHLIFEYYFVDGIWVNAFVVEKGKMGRVLEISGTSKNVKIAGYTYDFINRYIDAKWADYNSGKKLNRYRKTDFAVGIIEGFKSKLKNQCNTMVENNSSLALVKVKNPELEEYMSYKYPNIHNFKRKVSSQDVNVIKDGEQLGREMVISKGITEKKKEKGLLIGY